MSLFCAPNIYAMPNNAMKNNTVKQDEKSGLNIFFLDDDTDESYLFNEALEHSGLSVTLTNAHHGNQLYEYLQNKSFPDIVFLDINMPYKDGKEVLEEIRSHEKFSKLRIVIYSTSKKGNIVKYCYNAGADLFVVKPENFDGMVKVLQKVCSIDWKNFQRPGLDDGFVITE